MADPTSSKIWIRKMKTMSRMIWMIWTIMTAPMLNRSNKSLISSSPICLQGILLIWRVQIGWETSSTSGISRIKRTWMPRTSYSKSSWPLSTIPLLITRQWILEVPIKRACLLIRMRTMMSIGRAKAIDINKSNQTSRLPNQRISIRCRSTVTELRMASKIKKTSS